MSVDGTVEDCMSGVESLSVSSPPASPSPPPPAAAASLPFLSSSSSSSLSPSLTRSWPSSPLPSSRQVTARLYSCLQHSKAQEPRGHDPLTSHHPLTKGRQVSFKLSSPELRPAPVATPMTAVRPGETRPFRLGQEEEEKEEEERRRVEMELKLQSQRGRLHIEEMESVRSHLQTILTTAQRHTDTEELLEPVSHHLKDESCGSDATSHLLNVAALTGGMEDLFPRYSRLRGNLDPASFSSLSELQSSRESLERERSRRKQCEQQLLALQSKALALQQQLALALSADHKKDVMIEQLDKTLEKVVEGWRRHEQEKSEGVRRLQEEKEAVERERDKQREALDCFEKNLFEAAEALDKEQKRNKELDNTNKQLECEQTELDKCVSELRRRAERLAGEAEQEREEAERLRAQNQSLHSALQQQSQHNTHTHTHLQQQLTLLTQQLERERERVGQEAQLREEAQSSLQQLQQELEEIKKERDTARAEQAVEQARHEAQRSQWELEQRVCVEQQLTERINIIQQENNSAAAKLRQQHRKQLLDLSAHHEREVCAQVEDFRRQLQERDDKHHQLTLHLNSRITELQEELISVESSRKRLEQQREELVSRLQGMMRSHWTEALRLLASQDQSAASFSPTSLGDSSNSHSSPRDQDSSINTSNITQISLPPAAPQAVVLQLSRERERGTRGGERRRADSDFGLLNHSQAFCPLQPVLDDTQLSGVAAGDVSDVWDGPVGRGAAEKEREERGMERERERETHRPAPPPDMPTLRPTPGHAPSQPSTNQSRGLVKEVGSRVAAERHSQKQGDKAPPLNTQLLPGEDKAPPTSSTDSAHCEDRQTELQYYLTKLLGQSPVDLLPADQSKDHTHSGHQWVSSSAAPLSAAAPPPKSLPTPHLDPSESPHLERLTHSHTPQQIQQLLHCLLGSEHSYSEAVRVSVDPKRVQQDRKEAPSRSAQSSSSRGRRHPQRSGSKMNVWR